MERIDRVTAEYLISFSGGKNELESLAELQLQGAVALHNRLAAQKVAYLADEVGMGKTYIALGVVALMRRFNPALRVLYLLPKNNVRDKWEKDYRSFIEYNYRHRDLAVKGLDNRPVAPYLVCFGLRDLVQSVATRNARDYFICTSAFSFPLGNNSSDLIESLNQFDQLLPQHRYMIEELRQQIGPNISPAELGKLKVEIKKRWASALNAILPRFDLVVVDEAHNLKKSRTSSDRNHLLATLLGADDEQTCRVGRLLLLSATPYDRQLDHLRNQLDLFGFDNKVKLPDGNAVNETAHEALSELIVRRLNTIELAGKSHTRNMYRQEYRTGVQAEVIMSMEQQLFAGLLQKKVSEYLQENCAGRFELGMLASFESYLPGEKNYVIEFDGQDDRNGDNDEGRRDARDRHVVETLVDDYWHVFNNTTPPHPKMDWVANKLHRLSLEQGKKQLVFVRRVKSVSELKIKLEHAYDVWLGDYIKNDSQVLSWFRHYMSQARDRKTSLLEIADLDGEVEASSESFFTWFYRGRNAELEAAIASSATNTLRISPTNYRTALAQRSILFEPNWLCIEGMPSPRDLTINWDKLVPRGNRKPTPQLRFRHAQYAYLCTVREQGKDAAKKVAERILSLVFTDFKADLDIATPRSLEHELSQKTLSDSLRAQNKPELCNLYPDWSKKTFTILAEDDEKSIRYLHHHLIHHELLGVVCRLDHPFIDLYSLRDMRKENEEGTADSQLISEFIKLLARQYEKGVAFCSFQILRDIATNLDLLVKLNFPDAYHVKAGELTKYLTRQLSPLAPVSGATGENSGDRSPLARKFRMPGYPRVLVTTDVFQEGEDLHTFCDSVIHYGISASPIALEQKIGRADRVASLAFRNMTAASTAGENYHQHFIQVNYPHIRQSLEFFQVRQAAANLNAFQRSLHKLGGDQKFSQEVDIQLHLSNSDGIEPQIMEPLESLFQVKDKEMAGNNHQIKLAEDIDRVQARIDHVRQRVQHCLTDFFNTEKYPAILSQTPDGLSWNSQGAPEIQLRNARGLPELLFSATLRDEQIFDSKLTNAQERIDYLQFLQVNSLVRLQLLDDKVDGCIIKRNAEIYAGEKGILVDNEIIDTIKRVLEPEKAIIFLEECGHDSKLISMADNLCQESLQVSISKLDDGLISYFFKNEGRKQIVLWLASDAYLLISSRVLDETQTLELAKEERCFAESMLVESSLRRNARFDMVDFYINYQKELCVRACHPLEHLNQEELAFLMLTVASEADRLEQILLGSIDN